MAQLIIGGKSYELPIIQGKSGPNVLDIRKLYEQTGLFAYDPGFTSTASCDSGITFVDGELSILRYRGYPIQELVEHCSFLEIAYLLLNGDLPNIEEKKAFDTHIVYHSLIHEQLIQFYHGFRRDAHPMAIMVGVVGALSSFYHDSLDIHDEEQRELACYRLIAKMPNIAAMAYTYSIGRPMVYPRNDLGYVENLFSMMFSLPSETYKPNKVFVNALEKIMILHADHEQNASTSTVRLAGSSGANPFACISSGITALWGPSHGGANEEVLKMLLTIGSIDRIPEFIARAKDKNDSFLLMGFGHRVYKNYDPRAAIMRQICYEVLAELNIKNDPLLQIAVELEKIALDDPYFVERKLYPNVDFYSGIVLRAIGIPVTMFTVLFAVARTVGWIAHWREMISDPKQKIGRPRQLYLGNTLKHFKNLHDR